MLNSSDKINNYTLETYLGKGSYGEVWLAKKKIELSDDGISVALKFLGYQPQKGKAREDFIKEVRREVGTWIRASGHKNIVSVQDGFAFRDDTFVIVSDFAEGGSLGDWLQKNGGKSPSLEKTVEIMSEILDGLAHLHSQTPEKIIHRDLKPDNVLFKSGVPCITDFGVSRMSQTVTKSAAQMAATSAGTPLYMSPESFNNQPTSRSMDIWSAGVILYQMLSGSFPYYADNPISLALEVISGNPPKPLPADIPEAFQAVVFKALEKDVAKRFQTVEEMKSGLKEALKIRETAQRQPIADIPVRPVNFANTYEDLDKTEELKVGVTQDHREIEAEKERQREVERQKLEAERLQREAEDRKIQQENGETLLWQKEAEDALKEEQEEEERLKRAAIAQLQAGKNPLKYLLGMGGGITVMILFLIWMNFGSFFSGSNSNSANKPANTAGSSSGETFKNSIGMEFVKIPAGSFMMGSEKSESDEKPVHKVTISNNFYLGKYEVTQAQWKAVMGTNPSGFQNCDNCPVEKVSWEDVQEFIKKLNAKGEGLYRLPTEAEWEYAARAGTTGDYAGDLDSMAWYDKNSGSKTHEVGTKKANAWGLYDMHGNVWEWCEDWYGTYPSGAVTDPTGAASGSYRVYRGGSWSSYGRNLRSANRGNFAPSNRYNDLGFRLIRGN